MSQKLIYLSSWLTFANFQCLYFHHIVYLPFYMCIYFIPQHWLQNNKVSGMSGNRKKKLKFTKKAFSHRFYFNWMKKNYLWFFMLPYASLCKVIRAHNYFNFFFVKYFIHSHTCYTYIHSSTLPTFNELMEKSIYLSFLRFIVRLNSPYSDCKIIKLIKLIIRLMLNEMKQKQKAESWSNWIFSCRTRESCGKEW